MRKVNHFLGLRVPRGPCGFVWTFKRTLCRQSLWNFLCLSIKYSLGSPALVNIFREENRKPIQDVSDIEEPKEASQATFLPTSQLSLLLFRCLPPCPPPPPPPSSLAADHHHQGSSERSPLMTIQPMVLMCPPVSTNMQLQHSQVWDRQTGVIFSGRPGLSRRQE